MIINQLVNTPIGQGRCQGNFIPPEHNTLHEQRVVLVRLPINDQTRQYLRQSNCVTPTATQSGLWVFNESELR